MIENTPRKFRRDFRLGAALLPRDNPNPRKVAEALGGRIPQPKPAKPQSSIAGGQNVFGPGQAPDA